ncbi:trigger factor [Leekyejoonella antrihumi]|uniref:Trigger factor n=1 Tax=Leekyejoonella antrihumi TaxID=1660198 RepID=A0A563E641_9MICO|nr:trigger factor [Leekyejoonella antrihumi]TWP37661.1 trigger factor [Leekyejoonella antrihumi]
MKSAVETLNPTRVKLTVEVPYEELKPSIDAAYTSIGSQVQVPGFRKGKVPARIIDQRVGRGAVLQEAINEALPGFYGQALQENDVQPMGQPEVDVTQVPADDKQDFTFTAEVDVVPEFELPAFETIKVEVDPLEVTDEDVEAEMQTLRERFGTLVAADRPAATGDSVTVDLIATINDEPIDDVTGVAYEVGSGNMLDGMDAAIAGMSVGESKTFTTALAGGEHEGEDAEVTVTVQAVKERVLPELDDEFAQLASSHDTFAELKGEISEQAESTKRFEQGVQARDKVLDYLLENVEIPLPESVIEAEVHQHLEGEDRLEDDEHRAEVDEQARKSLKTQLMLDKIVRQDEIQVSQEELIEYLIMSAQQYGMDPNQFAQALDQQGQVPAVMGEVARRKALATVLETAKVVDTNGAEVDLKALEIEVDDADDAAAADDAADDDAADDDAADDDADDVTPESDADAAQRETVADKA